jgi:hypothetical protein
MMSIIRLLAVWAVVATLVACTQSGWIRATRYDGVQPVPGPPPLRLTMFYDDEARPCDAYQSCRGTMP